MASTKPLLIGYARVSTEDQDLRMQFDALAAGGVAKARIFSDKASGGRGTNRPGLAAALKACRKGDTICVWKLDRLGRDLFELIDTMRKLEAKGAHLRILTGLQIDTATAGGRLIFHIFGALAEFERELARERTMAGLAAAKARGRVGGRKRTVTAEMEAEAILLLKAGNDPRKVAAAIGVSASLIYQRMRGEWASRLAEGTAK
jgi:DNA invertase Pin-like site-specific DNA recombinase